MAARIVDGSAQRFQDAYAMRANGPVVLSRRRCLESPPQLLDLLVYYRPAGFRPWRHWVGQCFQGGLFEPHEPKMQRLEGLVEDVTTSLPRSRATVLHPVVAEGGEVPVR